MAASEACPTEDSIQALLDYLVDPLLPAKSSPRDIPSESQQQLVAKQMHAAILLYNYYHRKKYPQLELLRFESFCKLAVALKPTLLSHMKLMQQSDDVELDNVEKQLSITEKAIMTACDISASLEASKTCIPNVEGWPLSKITVFLTDSKRENCHLIFNSITQGVWSAIEKDLDILKQRPEGKTEVKIEEQHTNKRRRVIRKITKEVTSIDEARIQQLAYLAVKEATGINSTDLIVLERHVVYSLDREKSAARFYIMQCTQSTNVDVIQVPMKDIMDRFFLTIFAPF